MDNGFQQQQQRMDTGFQQLFDKISAVELSTKTNSDTIAIHSQESKHSQRFDAIDAKFVSLENKNYTEIASVHSKLIALEDNLMAKLSVSHTASSIPSFAATIMVLSKDTTAVTSSEPIKIKLVVDPAPPTRVISVPTTESISFSSGNTSAGDISIESTDIHEKNSVNAQAFEAENTSSQWGHALKKNQNYRYPPRWKKPPKSPIKQGSLSPDWRERDDAYKLYPDKQSLTLSVLHSSDKVPYCIAHRPPDDGYCNQSSRRKSRGPFRDKRNIKCFNCSGFGHYKSECPQRICSDIPGQTYKKTPRPPDDVSTTCNIQHKCLVDRLKFTFDSDESHTLHGRM